MKRLNDYDGNLVASV